MLRKNSKTSPCKELVPDFVTTSIWPPLDSPYSASKLLVKIRNSANSRGVDQAAAGTNVRI